MNDLVEVTLLEACLIFMGDPADLTLPSIARDGDRYIGERWAVEAWRLFSETEAKL